MAADLAAEPATLSNGEIELVIDGAHGAVITRLARVDGPNLLAERTWATPVPPSASSSYGDERVDFMAAYAGGWHETFPNFGTGGEVLGAPIPFHGDVARARWRTVSVTENSIEMECPSRLPVILNRIIRLDGCSIRVEETARSDCDFPVPILWGHHPVFPARPGMRIDLAGGELFADSSWQSAVTDLTETSAGNWPCLQVGGQPRDLSCVPDGVVTRLARVHRPPGAWAALRDPASRLGIGLCWDETVFGNVWLWLERGGSEFPWYGRANFIGIEPHSADTPDGLADAVRAGSALTVPAGRSLSTWLTMSVFDAGDVPVTGVDRGGVVSLGEPSN